MFRSPSSRSALSVPLAVAVAIVIVACGDDSSAPVTPATNTVDGGGGGDAANNVTSDAGNDDGASPIDGATDGGSGLADLPLRVAYLQGDVGFSAKVTIGTNEVEAMIDTGSSGLRVVDGDVKATDLVTRGVDESTANFSGGAAITGVVGTASITIAGQTTPTAIPIQVITKVGCTAAKPDCAAAGVALKDFTFKSGSGGTYRAIMGVGMRNGPQSGQVANPIVQLASKPGFIIDISGGYGAMTGVMHIGPAAADVAAFKTIKLPSLPQGVALPNGVLPADDRSIPVCINDTTTTKTFCTGALFDTGNGSTDIMWTATVGSGGILPVGDQIDVVVHADSTPTSATLSEYKFTIQAPPKAGLDRISVAPADANSMNIGTSPFFRNKVLLDQANATIGVLPF